MSGLARSRANHQRQVNAGAKLLLTLLAASVPPLAIVTLIRQGRASASGQTAAPSAFVLKASAFQTGGQIPGQYTCDGQNLSPALSWTEPPPGTQSFVLIAEDPDAPGGAFVHWVAYDLPGSVRRVPEGVPKAGEIKGGGRQGLNDFPGTGYGGPCPPPGKPHRYFFRLYSIDRKLNLQAGPTRTDVEQAMKGHILGQAELMGRYRR